MVVHVRPTRTVPESSYAQEVRAKEEPDRTITPLLLALHHIPHGMKTKQPGAGTLIS